MDPLDCDILNNFDNPSKSLQTPRGNNNGASSTEEQVVNNDFLETDVHTRSLGDFYRLVIISRRPGFLPNEYTERLFPCDLNKASFKCADVDAQQIWQIRSSTDWDEGSWC
jgi:hypothetical protein